MRILLTSSEYYSGEDETIYLNGNGPDLYAWEESLMSGLISNP